MPESLPVLFGRVVRRRREAAGLSQEELAEKTSLTRNYIGMVERGETNPTLGVMASLATVLGTTVASLVRSAEEAQARQSESPRGG